MFKQIVATLYTFIADLENRWRGVGGGQVFKRVRPVNGLIPGGWLDNFVQSLTLGKNTFVLSKTLV